MVHWPTAGHVVICAGNESKRNARPAKAGLNRLHPKPPKDIFTTPMANSAPRITIHTGKLEGKLKASNTPVMMAEPSLMVVSVRFIRYFPMTHSKNTQEATETNVTMKAPTPKKYNDVRKAGTNATSTPYIFLFTLSRLWICGDRDTVNLLIYA